MVVWGFDQVYELAKATFGDLGEDVVQLMAKIAMLESGGNTTAYNGTGLDNSTGLWQINTHPEANPQYANLDLTNPIVNAQAARQILLSQGPTAWSTFQTAQQEAPVVNQWTGYPKYPKSDPLPPGTTVTINGTSQTIAGGGGTGPAPTSLEGFIKSIDPNAYQIPGTNRWVYRDADDQPQIFDAGSLTQGETINVGGVLLRVAPDGGSAQVLYDGRASTAMTPEERLKLTLQNMQIAQQLGITSAGAGGLQAIGGALFDPLTREVIDPSTFGLSRDQFSEAIRQFNATFGEGQRQFNLGFGENQRQFDTTFGEDQRQFNIGTAEGQRQFNLGTAADLSQAKLQAALGGFNSVNQLAPQLGQLALDNARFTADMTQNPADFIARAFMQRGGESPLSVVSQADLINQLTQNIGAFNNVLGGFSIDPLNNPQFPNLNAPMVNPFTTQAQAVPRPAATLQQAPLPMTGFPQVPLTPLAPSQQVAPSLAPAPAPTREQMIATGQYVPGGEEGGIDNPSTPYNDVAVANQINDINAGLGGPGESTDYAAAIAEINALMGIPGFAVGTGMTNAPLMMVGDHPTGRPTGFEEIISNPTGAPLGVIPNPNNQMGVPTTPPTQATQPFNSLPALPTQAAAQAVESRPTSVTQPSLPAQAAPRAMEARSMGPMGFGMQRTDPFTALPALPSQASANAVANRPTAVTRPTAQPIESITPIPQVGPIIDPRLPVNRYMRVPERLLSGFQSAIPRFAEGTTYWSSDYPGQSSSTPWPGQQAVDGGTIASAPAPMAVTNNTSTPQSFYQAPPAYTPMTSVPTQTSPLGMNFTAPQLPTQPLVTQEQLIDYARRFSPPAVSSVINGTMPETLRFGFPLPNPQQLNSLTPAERIALNTRLATEFNTSLEDVEHAMRLRFSNARQRPRGRYAVGA